MDRKPTNFIIPKEPPFFQDSGLPTLQGNLTRVFNGRLPRCGCYVPLCNHCPVWASQFSWPQKLFFYFYFFCHIFSLSLGPRKCRRFVFLMGCDIGGLDDLFFSSLAWLGFGVFSRSWGKVTCLLLGFFGADGFLLRKGSWQKVYFPTSANTLLSTGGSNAFVTVELGTISGRFSKLVPEETRLTSNLDFGVGNNNSVVRTLNYEFTTDELVWMDTTLCILMEFSIV